MNRREIIQRLLLTAIGGVLMGLATEPWGLWGFAWVALVPLWVNCLTIAKIPAETRSVSPLQMLNGLKLPLIFALIWGIGYYGIALFWITGIHPMTWLGIPGLASLAIALFCWSFITLWGTALVMVWTGLFLILSAVETRHGASLHSAIFLALTRVLIGTALWCGLESLWSSGALWWSSLSYTQSFGNLIILHLGQISGPTTVTAILLIVNGLIAEGLIFDQNQKTVKLLILALIFFISSHILGLILYSRPLNNNPEQALKVGIIQGNIPNEIKLNPVGFLQALQGYTTGYITLANQGVDLVLTPETALPFFWTDPIQRHNSSFYQAILKEKVPALVGSFALKEEGYTNSLFSINQDGKIISEYDKINLVPLGEFIPFSEILGQFIRRLSPLEATLIHGKPGQTFQTPFGQATVGICYDSAFASHFRNQTAQGGEFILTASNDAHYSSTMLAQHHALDVMRAIENDRWTIRATNTGYSAVVDPHGRTLWLSHHNTYELYADIIYRYQTQTLYVRWGNWLMPVLLIIGITVFFIKIDLFS
ncbi:Apolipoprotein N-acyltransferase [Planktothrix tepida]|uniref:Apolipoprotein N-acyltransferase n=2 Tax=Planktothrix TaxID=54304 RepID=A0A1J1LVS6_9CYAN|nr:MULTISPECIES: apolipoprotein N-acyltransferase [Planktothrix]CAD5930620.1 Apolipoprotein N-acyltransferase [Planktothrix pseudagardhii]CAD5978364.1 Apolipoprotein N-acyltransferase [Planktothrix tepida]CUR36076.1 Apolipoprotein N-acyltransferase [Planktothrix tepida PCC 9214]